MSEHIKAPWETWEVTVTGDGKVTIANGEDTTYISAASVGPEIGRLVAASIDARDAFERGDFNIIPFVPSEGS